MFVCLFVCLFVFFVPLEIFQLIWRRNHYGERLQTLNYTQHSWPLSSEVSFACHTYGDTWHPFIMFISENLWHSHLLPSVKDITSSKSPLCMVTCCNKGNVFQKKTVYRGSLKTCTSRNSYFEISKIRIIWYNILHFLKPLFIQFWIKIVVYNKITPITLYIHVCLQQVNVTL